MYVFALVFERGGGGDIGFSRRKANGCFYVGPWCEGSGDDGLGESS